MRREFLDELRESYFPDLRGGKAYIDSPRHAAYVDKDTYRGVLMSILRDLGWPALTDQSFEAMKVDCLVAAELRGFEPGCARDPQQPREPEFPAEGPRLPTP